MGGWLGNYLAFLPVYGDCWLMLLVMTSGRVTSHVTAHQSHPCEYSTTHIMGVSSHSWSSVKKEFSRGLLDVWYRSNRTYFLTLQNVNICPPCTRPCQRLLHAGMCVVSEVRLAVRCLPCLPVSNLFVTIHQMVTSCHLSLSLRPHLPSHPFLYPFSLK